MINEIKPVSYFNPNDPAGSKSLAQQMMAAQLMQQIAQQQEESGGQPLEGGFIPANSLAPGRTVAVSPVAALAKALQEGMGGYMKGNSMRQQIDLQQAMMQRQYANMQAMYGQGPAAITGNGTVDPTQQALPPDQNGISWNAPRPTQFSGQNDRIGKAIMAAKNAEFNGVGEAGQKFIYDNYTPTNEMKNAADSHVADPVALAGALKGAEQSHTIFPNQTINGRENVPVTGAQIMGQGMPQTTQAGIPVSQLPPALQQSMAANPVPNGSPVPPVPQVASGTPLPNTGSNPELAPYPGFKDPVAALPALGAPDSQNGPTPAMQFGMPIGQKEGMVADAAKEGENIAETEKAFAAAHNGLPYAMKRFNDMRDAAKNSSSGYGVDNEGDGWKQELWDQLGGKTADANNMLMQKSAQQILPDLAPTLSQAGIKGNKFIENLSAQASGLDMRAPPPTKMKLVDGLQSTYVNNLKAMAATLRDAGHKDIPSDQEIDTAAATYNGTQQNAAAPITKVLNGVTYTKINGQWHQ